MADVTFPENVLNRIALIAPNARINIINDYEVVNKHTVSLPNVVVDIIKCGNPKCITNNEPMRTRFQIVDSDNVILKCHYCERSINIDEVELK